MAFAEKRGSILDDRLVTEWVWEVARESLVEYGARSTEHTFGCKIDRGAAFSSYACCALRGDAD